jgi:RimJ/RimL family protein N-acetyltransferase
MENRKPRRLRMTGTAVTAQHETEGTSSAQAPGHHGQTFLVGEEVYLRPVETGDAAIGMSWMHIAFPRSTDRVETWIKEDMARDRDTSWYAIVRKVDDRVVGSITFNRRGVDVWLDVRVDELFGDRALHWKAEALTLIVPWLVDERGRTSVKVDLPADEEPVIEALQSIGMQQCARLREMFDRDGKRIDRLSFHFLNKAWLKSLGDPLAIEIPRTGTGLPRPVPPRVTLDGDPPKNAVLVGQRVYLRQPEPGDAVEEATLARRETETFFDIGRYLPGSVGGKNWRNEVQKSSLPRHVWFAVCLRETDEYLGIVGLIRIDYHHRFAETGSFFNRQEFRGGGYGSEAKHLLLEWAFEVLGLHMVQSWVYFPNTRSAAALRKQGYSEAGRMVWAYSHNGTLDSFVLFDLLATEWRALPRAEWNAPVTT